MTSTPEHAGRALSLEVHDVVKNGHIFLQLWPFIIIITDYKWDYTFYKWGYKYL